MLDISSKSTACTDYLYYKWKSVWFLFDKEVNAIYLMTIFLRYLYDYVMFLSVYGLIYVVVSNFFFHYKWLFSLFKWILVFRCNHVPPWHKITIHFKFDFNFTCQTLYKMTEAFLWWILILFILKLNVRVFGVFSRLVNCCKIW